MDNYPTQYVRYSNSFQKIQQELLEKQGAETFRKPEVRYIYGSTGVGKTRYVMEKYGYQKVFRVTKYSKGLFDSYNNQDVILFDEFRSSIPITKMLVYLDGYPVTLPCRYYNKQALFTKVYIISNISLQEQYKNIQVEEPKTYDALLRRITAVYNFDKSKDIPITHDARLIPIDVDIRDIFWKYIFSECKLLFYMIYYIFQQKR